MWGLHEGTNKGSQSLTDLKEVLGHREGGKEARKRHGINERKCELLRSMALMI